MDWMTVINLVSSGCTIFAFLAFIANRVTYVPGIEISARLEGLLQPPGDLGSHGYKAVAYGGEHELYLAFQNVTKYHVRINGGWAVMFDPAHLTILPPKYQNVQMYQGTDLDLAPQSDDNLWGALHVTTNELISPGGVRGFMFSVQWRDGITQADVAIYVRASVDESCITGLSGMFGPKVNAYYLKVKVYRPNQTA